uniref:Uncharacterized protein n=1 Tax=Glossina brevipalpis TaxID=37001 RepID=A0A1A9W997_9MUSC
MKLLILALTTILTTINSIAAFKLFGTVQEMLECQMRLHVPLEDAFFTNSRTKDLADINRHQKCAMYCQAEAFGLTTGGVLNEDMVRGQLEYERSYNVDDIIRNCKDVGAANDCDGALKLNLCIKKYYTPNKNGSHVISILDKMRR